MDGPGYTAAVWMEQDLFGPQDNGHAAAISLGRQALIRADPPVGSVGVSVRLTLGPPEAVAGAPAVELRLPTGEIVHLPIVDRSAARLTFTPTTAGDHEFRWHLADGTAIVLPYPVEPSVARGAVAAWSIPLGLLLAVLIRRQARAAATPRAEP